MASQAISELAPLAQALNEESNSINATIAALNKQLAALKLGLEVWTKAPDGNEYGFALVDEAWQLAIRWEGEAPDPRDRSLESVTYHQALLKRSRNQRITGLEVVSEIIDKLKSEAQAKIAIIQHAKKFAAGPFNENGVGSVSGIVGHPDITDEDLIAQVDRRKRGDL